ncbi:hypothetical protein C2E31_11140 [Rhodopirellula baltica]|nr:hypothetical protein C2E31_20330 [Rhodopirellula baltica]PNY36799.1 hypothetical protein C2E31_11140 [Rhodopirellula baltica]
MCDKAGALSQAWLEGAGSVQVEIEFQSWHRGFDCFALGFISSLVGWGRCCWSGGNLKDSV